MRVTRLPQEYTNTVLSMNACERIKLYLFLRHLLDYRTAHNKMFRNALKKEYTSPTALRLAVEELEGLLHQLKMGIDPALM